MVTNRHGHGIAEFVPVTQWPQREDRSSWRTAAANALARASAGAAYVDVFEPTLALHPWRTNVVHLELPSFAKAVYTTSSCRACSSSRSTLPTPGVWG